MVPLANAWRTGAADWTDAQRSDFANDLTRPQLLAVSLSTNRSKGDQDPSEWKPPRRSYWCVYAQRWVAVKDYWKLRVTAAEKCGAAPDAGDLRMSETRSTDVKAGPGGVMTDEVGVVTGDLTVRTEVDDDGTVLAGSSTRAPTSGTRSPTRRRPASSTRYTPTLVARVSPDGGSN